MGKKWKVRLGWSRLRIKGSKGLKTKEELSTLVFAESGTNLKSFFRVSSRQPLLIDTSMHLWWKAIWFPFLDSDTWVAKYHAFDGSNLNESFLCNECQVMAFKNLSDYICFYSLILEKTISVWDQWKSRPWHLGSSRNITTWWQHFILLTRMCLVVCLRHCNSSPSRFPKKINPLGWWFKVTPTVLYSTSVVSAKMTWFARTQYGSPSTPPTSNNMPRLIRSRCCCHRRQNLILVWAGRHTLTLVHPSSCSSEMIVFRVIFTGAIFSYLCSTNTSYLPHEKQGW